MKPAGIVLIVAGAVVVAGAIAALFLFGKKPDLSAYLPLKEPRIADKPSELVLEVPFSGSKDAVIAEAFGKLFKAYYSLKGVPKGGPSFKAPKARFRFPIDLSMPAEARLKAIAGKPWEGVVGIPVPEGTVLAERAKATGARLARWEYGLTAEILHLGSYASEPPTIQKLEDFIKAQGYRVVGDHEEEYLRGGEGHGAKPEDYWTIIRYRVAK